MLEGFVDNEDIYSWANVLHWPYTGAAPSDADCAAIGTYIAGQWNTHMAPECPAPTILRDVVVIDLTGPTAGQWDTVVAINGTRGDDSIPANAAYLVSYPVGTRYRGGHPRTYLYVLGNADLEGAAKWSTLATAEVLAHWIAFIEAVNGHVQGGTTLGTFCAVSYYSGVDPITHKSIRRAVPLVLPLDVTLARGRQEMASQRGRIGRRRS
jgi:hypothetical protein